MVNTMGKLASFGRFSITIVSASSISLATDHYSHAPRHPSHLPPGPAGSGHAQTLPLVTACNRPPNWERPNGPDLDERPSIFSMSPNQAIPADKINPFLPTRRRPTVDHSLVAGGAQGQWLQACLAG